MELFNYLTSCCRHAGFMGFPILEVGLSIPKYDKINKPMILKKDDSI